ncbi:hypothetical protein GCM10025857_10130 [Alicyclobacillus contaminans]|uniref:hypothetical protein n=1 Tax=Alicyclobacillus contaminans TaxID=392016 RepID=UPI000419EDE1|nr:hypothetical protein [Alicyclobacillus contaminans]GMA49656.1 hypothetical protein GCM10025857_10130 [Alicyclobacillus contaminans]
MEWDFNHMVNEKEAYCVCPYCEESFRISPLKLQSGLPIAECPHCLRRVEVSSTDV